MLMNCAFLKRLTAFSTSFLFVSILPLYAETITKQEVAVPSVKTQQATETHLSAQDKRINVGQNVSKVSRKKTKQAHKLSGKMTHHTANRMDKSAANELLTSP